MSDGQSCGAYNNFVGRILFKNICSRTIPRSFVSAENKLFWNQRIVITASRLRLNIIDFFSRIF